jgi:F-type H+-transporting ATPase subunit epsilon
MSGIKLDVVSAEEELYSGEVAAVFAPGAQGELGIYPGHMALLATLKPGEVRLQNETGEESIFVAGGMIEVQPEVVTIFSDTAIRAKDLDEEKALKAKQAAEDAMANATEDMDVTRAQNALAEAMAQLQLISKIRKR